jgi:hypothetical protein
VRCIDDAGHAVLAEKEGELLREVAAFLRRHLDDSERLSRAAVGKTPGVGQGPPAVPKPRSSLGDVRLAGLQLCPFSVSLAKPLALSTGMLTERRGLHVLLSAESVRRAPASLSFVCRSRLAEGDLQPLAFTPITGRDGCG